MLISHSAPIHPVAAAHARSLRWQDAAAIGLLTDTDQLGFGGPDGELSDLDKAFLIRACAALTYRCYCCETSKPLSEWSRDSIGLDLCEACYDEAGLENEHSDGYHDADQDGPNPACPDCRAALAAIEADVV